MVLAEKEDECCQRLTVSSYKHYLGCLGKLKIMHSLEAGVSENDDNDEDVEPADDDREFMKLLGNEIDKVTHFYTSKVSRVML